MIWVFVFAIATFILYSFLRDRNKMLETQVDNLGGMKNKYSELIKEFTKKPNTNIVKITRDSIYISYIGKYVEEHYVIVENFNSVSLKAIFVSREMHTKVEHNWTFSTTKSQTQIIQEVQTFIDNLSGKMFVPF